MSRDRGSSLHAHSWHAVPAATSGERQSRTGAAMAPARDASTHAADERHDDKGPSPMTTLTIQNASITIATDRLMAERYPDLNTNERRALLVLLEADAADERMTMSGLAERTILTRATVTALVDRMEARGYLVRVPSERDRRMTEIELDASVPSLEAVVA